MVGPMRPIAVRDCSTSAGLRIPPFDDEQGSHTKQTSWQDIEKIVGRLKCVEMRTCDQGAAVTWLTATARVRR
jgi:hypothetical protein